MVNKTARGYMLRVRMSNDEHVALQAVADAAGLSASDYLRQHIRQARTALAATLLFPPKWKRLAEAAGGAAALEVRLGVEEGTVRRWARKESPVNGVALHKVRAISAALKVPPPI